MKITEEILKKYKFTSYRDNLKKVYVSDLIRNEGGYLYFRFIRGLLYMKVEDEIVHVLRTEEELKLLIKFLSYKK